MLYGKSPNNNDNEKKLFLQHKKNLQRRVEKHRKECGFCFATVFANTTRKEDSAYVYTVKMPGIKIALQEMHMSNIYRALCSPSNKTKKLHNIKLDICQPSRTLKPK